MNRRYGYDYAVNDLFRKDEELAAAEANLRNAKQESEAKWVESAKTMVYKDVEIIDALEEIFNERGEAMDNASDHFVGWCRARQEELSFVFVADTLLRRYTQPLEKMLRTLHQAVHDINRRIDDLAGGAE